MLRPATIDDLPTLVEMGGRFIRSTSYAGRLGDNDEARRSIMRHLIESDDGLLMVVDDGGLTGMIAAGVAHHPLSGEKVAAELFWWSEGGDGMKLLSAAETWAKSKGVKAIQMVAPDDRVGMVYQRRGYKRLETTYQMEIA